MAQAFVLGAEFLDGGPGCLILGDNMFYGQGFSAMLKRAASIDKGCLLYTSRPVDVHYYIPSQGDIKQMPIVFVVEGGDRG